MPPDIEKYLKHVDHFDLSEDQKLELIHTVWSVMQSLCDRAFGLDSAQLACSDIPDEVGADHRKRVELLPPRLPDQFERSTGQQHKLINHIIDMEGASQNNDRED